MRHSSIDRWILWYLPTIMGVLFIGCTCMQVGYFQVNDWDYSFFLTQPWRISQGLEWTTPFALPGEDIFYAHHFTPLSLLIAPFLYFFPSPFTLAVLHGLSAAFFCFLVPRLTRILYIGSPDAAEKDWRLAALFMLAVFFCFFPWLGAFGYATHYTTLVTPLIALAIYGLYLRRPVLACVCCGVVLLANERAAMGVFGVGMYAFLLLRNRRLGILIMSGAAVWFFGVVSWVLPALRRYASLDETYAFAKAIAPAALPAKKALFLLKLLGVTLCLPLCGKRALFSALCALPTLSLSLVSNRSSMLTFMFHYQDMATAFLLISMIYGYQWLQAHIGEGRPRLWKRGVALVMIGYAVACIATPRFQNPIRIMKKIVFDERFKDWHALNHDIRVLEDMPEDVSLYVQSGLGPRLALHPRRFLAYAPTLSLVDPGKSLFVLSPLAGSYQLDGGYEHGVLLAEANPRLHLLANNGRLRVYASDGFLREEPGLTKAFQKEIGLEPAAGE